MILKRRNGPLLWTLTAKGGQPNMSPEDSSANDEKVTVLQQEIEAFLVPLRRRHVMTFRGNAALIIVGLALSAGVTIASILDYGLIAAILGVAIGYVIGVQNAFPIGEKAEFYRLLIAEGDNPINELKFEVKTDAEFLDRVDKFKKLRMYGAENLPRGQGMQAVKNFHKDMSAP
jgi:hypothetical protein